MAWQQYSCLVLSSMHTPIFLTKLCLHFNPTWYGPLNYLVVWGGAESARREKWPLRQPEGTTGATNHNKYSS